MQGRSDPQRELLDVESLAGHLLPEGGVFAFLAGHRRELFGEELFAAGRGRPSVPVEVVASVIVLQTLHGLSDRDATDVLTLICAGRPRAASLSPTRDFIRRR